MLANSLRAQTRAILAASSRVSSASRFTRASPICTSFSRLLSTSHVLRAAGFAQHSERRRQGDEDEYGGSEGTGVFSRRRGGGDNVRSRPEPSDEDATTTLYVGNLAFWASEDDVRKLFEPFGDLQDVRLKMTPDGQNRGFAHVEFATPEITRAVMRAHAEEALDFSGRMLKLDYAQTSNFASRMTTRTEDPATQTPRSTLYVGNLPYSVDAEELRQLFSSIAEVQDIRVVYNAEGVSRGFAHVDFASIEDAQRVLERQKEQDFSLQQRMLFVSYARRSQAEDGDKSSRRRNPPSETLWVGGLPEGTREEDLRDIFEPLGEIRAVRLKYSDNGRPFFAHVDLPSVEVAQAIMEEHRKSALQLSSGKEVLLDFAPRLVPQMQTPNKTLYLPSFEENERLLRLCFGEHASTIRSVRFVNTKGGSQPSAFVDFDSVESAIKAKNAFDGKEVQPGLNLRLLFSRRLFKSGSDAGRSHGGDWNKGRGARKSSYGMRDE